MKIVSFLYTLARKTNDLRAIFNLFKGKPDSFLKRIINKQIGKNIVRKFFLR